MPGLLLAEMKFSTLHYNSARIPRTTPAVAGGGIEATELAGTGCGFILVQEHGHLRYRPECY